MSSHSAFRCHILQQFVTNARNNQSRTPPIALIGWIDEQHQHHQQQHQQQQQQKQRQQQRTEEQQNQHQHQHENQLRTSIDTIISTTTTKRVINNKNPLLVSDTLSAFRSSLQIDDNNINNNNNRNNNINNNNNVDTSPCINNISSRDGTTNHPQQSYKSLLLLPQHHTERNEIQQSLSSSQLTGQQRRRFASVSTTSLSDPTTTTTTTITAHDHYDDDNNCNDTTVVDKTNDEQIVTTNNIADTSLQQNQSDLSIQFQNLIQSRRTASRFSTVPLQSNSSSKLVSGVETTTTTLTTTLPQLGTKLVQEQLVLPYSNFWYNTIDRAVIAGISAPNHKRTEPFSFRRIVAPSIAHSQLSDIVYHTTLLKLLVGNTSNSLTLQKQKHIQPTEEMINKAQRKRSRWASVPAFLVTLVDSNTTTTTTTTTSNIESFITNDKDESSRNNMKDGTSSENSTVVDDDDFDALLDLYKPRPFVTLTSERELEDYASACAAVQNCLLSFHSENLATKWATGSVINTTAFRQLVQAKPTDRIVALIMIGFKDNDRHQHQKHKDPNTESSAIKPLPHRKMRRKLHGDILIDL